MQLKLLNLNNYDELTELLSKNINDFNNFKKIYKPINQTNSQIQKKNNHKIFLIGPNKLIRFIVVSLICIEKKSEYEILLVYVDYIYRESGYTSYLINALTTSSYFKPLRKITLEFSKK